MNQLSSKLKSNGLEEKGDIGELILLIAPHITDMDEKTKELLINRESGINMENFYEMFPNLHKPQEEEGKEGKEEGKEEKSAEERLFDAVDINKDKFKKLGIKKLHDWYKANYSRRITNYTKNRVVARRMMIEHAMKEYEKTKFSVHSAQPLHKLVELVNEKRKVKKNGKDFTKYKVGDKIIHTCYNGSYDNYCGLITKVNKASIRFKPYKIGKVESDDENACYKQIKEERKHYYDKENFQEEKTIRTNFKSIGEVETDFEINKFEYYTTWVDWGR